VARMRKRTTDGHLGHKAECGGRWGRITSSLFAKKKNGLKEPVSGRGGTIKPFSGGGLNRGEKRERARGGRPIRPAREGGEGPVRRKRWGKAKSSSKVGWELGTTGGPV